MTDAHTVHTMAVGGDASSHRYVTGVGRPHRTPAQVVTPRAGGAGGRVLGPYRLEYIVI